jgi:hypothetical protein
MPELSRQLAKGDAFTADYTVARAPPVRGRGDEDAVKAFEPYERPQEPNPGAREALRAIAARSMGRKRPAFLLVDNRLEGHAPSTIEAAADALASWTPPRRLHGRSKPRSRS